MWQKFFCLLKSCCPLQQDEMDLSPSLLIKKLGVYFLRLEKASPVCNKISWELVSQLLQVDS